MEEMLLTYKYDFVDGDSAEIDLTPEWESKLREYDHAEKNNNRTETRRLVDIECEPEQVCHDLARDDSYFDSSRRHLYPALYDALDHLTPAQQEVIYSIFFLELTERETAEKLHITQPTVHAHKERALAKLKKLLSGQKP